tara:strand:- start:38 stop:211 length:174 start_codon:yes stop_codon:yes gene_type:complete
VVLHILAQSDLVEMGVAATLENIQAHPINLEQPTQVAEVVAKVVIQPQLLALVVQAS